MTGTAWGYRSKQTFEARLGAESLVPAHLPQSAEHVVGTQAAAVFFIGHGFVDIMAVCRHSSGGDVLLFRQFSFSRSMS